MDPFHIFTQVCEFGIITCVLYSILFYQQMACITINKEKNIKIKYVLYSYECFRAHL